MIIIINHAFTAAWSVLIQDAMLIQNFQEQNFRLKFDFYLYFELFV